MQTVTDPALSQVLREPKTGPICMRKTEQPLDLIRDSGTTLSNDYENAIVGPASNDQQVSFSREHGNSGCWEVKTVLNSMGMVLASVIPSDETGIKYRLIISVTQINKFGIVGLFTRCATKYLDYLVHSIEFMLITDGWIRLNGTEFLAR